MNCGQCQGIEDLFNEEIVARELASYRQKGPDKTTRVLVREIEREGVQGMSLLDIGGGLGAVQQALLRSGVEQATDVEASQAYLNAAREEAQRQGVAERISFQHGNFVEVAARIPPADIVTLDRVLCCYPDMEELVSLSAARAKRVYGVVYPRDGWWVKLGVWIFNFIFALRKSPFRVFNHPTRAVDRLIRGSGFQQRFHYQTLIWQVAVYDR